MTVHRIFSWNEFKSLVISLKPDAVFYLSEPHPLRNPPLGLRLTFYNRMDMYVFTDFADKNVLHKTRIPLTTPDDMLKAEIKEEDIKRFLREEFHGTKCVSLPPFMY